MATVFLRTVGLDSLNFAARDRFRQQEPEQPKVVISRSLRDTLARCSIHFVPCAVSAAIIALNCKGVYLGASLIGSGGHGQGFAPTLIQLAAKLQEIFVVSSLGLVIFHFVRYELLYGEGTSLGFLFAGFNFSHISYFWSPSFCNGWTIGRGALRLRRFLLILLVLSSGIIASFAGPASALLMMPLAQRWTYRDDNIAIAGTSSQLFPNNLTINNVGAPDCLNGTFILNSGQRCINNGYAALSAFWRNHGSSYWDGHLATIYDDFSNGRVIEVHNPPQTTRCTWTSMPHAAVSAMLKDIWWDPSWKSNLSSSAGYAEVEAPAPWVRVKCSDLYKTNLSELQYPVLPQTDDWDGKTYAALGLSANMLDFLNSIPHQPVASPFTTFWNQPDSTMGYASAGLTTFLRNSGDNTTDRNLRAFSCTIDARWMQSNTSKADGIAGIVASANIDFSYSNQKSVISPISMDLDWLDNLTPQVHYWDYDTSDASNTTGTAMGALLSAYWLYARNLLATDWNSSRMIAEVIISSYITEGISRVGLFEYMSANRSQAALNDTNSQTFRLHTSVTGFAYSIHSSSTYYAISVLALHMLVATTFVIYLIYTNETSSCWDSIEEIFALAHSSTPDPLALANTSAGIHRFGTMARNVKVRAVDGGSGDGRETGTWDFGNAETLQLVFGADADGTGKGKGKGTGMRMGTETNDEIVVREAKYGQAAYKMATIVYQTTELCKRTTRKGGSTETSTQSLLPSTNTVNGGGKRVHGTDEPSQIWDVR